MAGEFTVTPETFSPAAGQMRQAASELTSAWQPVKAQSLGVQFGRGDDMVSPLIQVSLQAAVQMLDSCISSSAEALNGFATGLENMGNTYARTEQGTNALMRAE